LTCQRTNFPLNTTPAVPSPFLSFSAPFICG
jgi:hypothetical protein